VRELSRDEVVAARVRAQQLDRPPGSLPVAGAAVLDLGVQDTGRDGASWALANRGVPVTSPEAMATTEELALVWTLRGAPHFYRRADLPDVLVATSPFSDADAAKRVFGADAPLRAAGIGPREGLTAVAAQLRGLVRSPMVKGEVSGGLSTRLPEPYLRDCVPCGARHPWEIPFRVCALYAGLELVPGTSPPVLRPILGWECTAVGPAEDPLAAPPRLQVVRAHLRLLGPAVPKDVAAFLDAPVSEVKAHWPEDAEQVEVQGRTAWWLPTEDDRAAAGTDPARLVRLLGPFDLLLQGRDRDLLVPDPARHKALWPTLGRPGAVLLGTEVVGTWRPRASGRRLTVTLDPWRPLTGAVRRLLEEEAERLAAHRGVTLSALEG